MKEELRKLPLLLLIIFLLFGCKTSCPMKQVDKWQTQKVGTDIERQTEAIASLVAAVEGDISTMQELLDSTKLDLKLGWEFSSEVKRNKYKETVWDKDVWQEMRAGIEVYCATRDEIERGVYKTSKQYQTAIDRLEKTKEFLTTAKKKLEESSTKS